ncbi:MAG TPA: hypothetical protein VIH72_01320 [Candidatus Acidoferrales bacterium]|jgi:hypothetical protein
MQRPTGVTVIAVLDFIGAGFAVIGALLMFMGGSILASFFSAAATANGATGTAPAAGIMASIGIIAGVIVLCFAILAIFIAMGLLKLKNWARITTIVLSALGLLSTLSRFLHGFAGGGMVVTIIVLAYYIWVIWYMLQPNVKAAFGETAAA